MRNKIKSLFRKLNIVSLRLCAFALNFFSHNQNNTALSKLFIWIRKNSTQRRKDAKKRSSLFVYLPFSLCPLWLKLFIIILMSIGCSRMDQSENERVRKCNEKKETIYRLEHERIFSEVESREKKREKYPWEELYMGMHSKINKEYFRCKGSDINPPIRGEGGKEEIIDCGGLDKHGLPFQENQEFIYPILIDLVNYIQEKSEGTVVITTGHRCPVHNRYAEQAKIMQSSKHQLGAEVDFYVEGFEEKPLEVIKWIMDYYQAGQSAEYNRFIRCQKNPEGLKHPGWYNKEILLRIHEKTEGRDYDNRHPYPYITIEVRFDKQKNEAVNFDWDKAIKGYLRN